MRGRLFWGLKCNPLHFEMGGRGGCGGVASTSSPSVVLRHRMFGEDRADHSTVGKTGKGALEAWVVKVAAAAVANLVGELGPKVDEV